MGITLGRATACVAFTLLLRAPALAMFPVIDIGSIKQEIFMLEKEAQTLQRTIELVQSARTNLRQLDGGVMLTNISSRLSSATSLIAQAQAVCMNAMNGGTPPAACTVRANVASFQAGNLAASMATLASLQSATRGSIGGLQAQQASAHALVEVATQLQQLHQLSLAEATQRGIDEKAINHALKAPPDYNPWGP